MMYDNKLAVAIKSAGKVLREQKDQVFVPFGTEYSILIKNLNTIRALVKISIDGKNVNGDDGSFVVHPGQSLDVERFITNGNLECGNRFKFIERTSSVEQHRGIGIEDGLVRVEFQFERQPIEFAPLPFSPTTVEPTWKGPLRGWFINDSTSAPPQPTYTITSSSASIGGEAQSLTVNDVGITVPGSISNQSFHRAELFAVTPTKHVIVLKLVGEVDGRVVERAVDVKHKPKCSTCGRVNKATAKFCANCGTSLQLV